MNTEQNQMNFKPEELLTLVEIAEAFNITPVTIRNDLRSGRIKPTCWIGKRARFTVQDFIKAYNP